MQVKKTVKKAKASKKTSKASLDREKKKKLKLLESLKGIGIGIWEEDAQEYVNKLRDNDRF
jgi:hypothetical protein